MIRKAAQLLGLLGYPLLILAGLSVFPPKGPLSADGGFTPAVAAMVGVFLVWLHLLAARGFRKLPFWCSALGGSILAVTAVSPSGTGGHDGVILLVAIGLLLTARVVMSLSRVNSRRFIPVAAVLAAAALVVPMAVDIPLSEDSPDLVYQNELKDLLALLHPGHRRFAPEAEEYVENMVQDGELEREEQEKRIEELNRRIEDLESEILRFEEAEQRRSRLDGEIERLRRLVEEAPEPERLPEAADLEMVTSYIEAVRPDVPMVRDFAVRLASAHPGSYYRSAADMDQAIPGETGIRQVVAIHTYLMEEWKYINDSLFISGDYYSPADRTISLGFAGDCDDFAILMASCVEAVGGMARIMHGTCTDGAHAWCEVYIGDGRAWKDTLAVLGRIFPGRRISYLVPGGGGGYWLCLDWEIGVYSCGNEAATAYESTRRYRS